MPSWSRAGVEPDLWELLADPVVLGLMRADHITRRDVLDAATHEDERAEPAPPARTPRASRR